MVYLTLSVFRNMQVATNFGFYTRSCDPSMNIGIKSRWNYNGSTFSCDKWSEVTEELHLSGLIKMTSHPDMQKIRIIGFFFEKKLHRQICSPAVAIHSMYLRLNLSTTPDLKF